LRPEDIKGANYIPSYARDDIELWLKFDSKIVNRELGYAEALGLNSVRVWINYAAYEMDPQLVVNNFEEFLTLCEKHNLTAMPILFDSCMVDKNDPETVKWFINLIRHLGYEGYMGGAENWPQSPGYSRLGEEYWEKIERYVETLVEPHINDKRVIVWDLMNEPFGIPSSYPTYDEKRISSFLKHFSEYIKRLSKVISLTIGASSWDGHACCVSKVEDLVDIVSFHSYEANPVLFDKIMDKVRDFKKKKGKPVILSEWGNSPYSVPRAFTDQEQLRYYETIMPLVANAEIGWYFFDLVVGQAPFPYCGIFYPTGERRPAASIIQTFTR